MEEKNKKLFFKYTFYSGVPRLASQMFDFNETVGTPTDGVVPRGSTNVEVIKDAKTLRESFDTA
jgi:hypothetical protein